MPKLDTNFFSVSALELLKKSKIFTVNDFLQADFEKLVCSALSEEEIIAVISKLIDKYAAQPKNGLNLYQHLLKETNIIETYIESLDELLNGGLLTGRIYEICGFSGSGKTQICLSISINVALKMKYHITYIDTKGDFYSTRLQQILRTKFEEDSESILDRINVILVKDIYRLINVLYSIKNCAFPNGDFGKVIIIDSLAVLFFPFITLTNNEGISLLNHIATILKMIAVEHHVAIVLTNLGTKFEDILDIFNKQEEPINKTNNEIMFSIKPSLGKYWQHVPNTRLIITKINNINTQRIAMVSKSDYLKLGNMCTLDIFNGGVR